MDHLRKQALDAVFTLRPNRSSAMEQAVEFRSLWVRGSLDALSRRCVAIVGTRGATASGKATARRFASELGAAGCCIVSGLALGIDAAAHSGALDAGARTIGILGGGHDCFFPERNRELAERMIAAGGAVVSPFPPAHPALPHQFLKRNALVAALCDAVVVIEAPERSGAINTANRAVGHIPVFAVPGEIDRPHVAGCHTLIRDGATLARSARDVLDDLHVTRFADMPPAPAVEPHSDLERALLTLLCEGERAIDELLDAVTGEPAQHVVAALAMLELRGGVECRPGQRYALR